MSPGKDMERRALGVKRAYNSVRTVISAEVHTVGSNAEANMGLEGDNSKSVCPSLLNTFPIYLSQFAALLDQIGTTAIYRVTNNDTARCKRPLRVINGLR